MVAIGVFGAWLQPDPDPPARDALPRVYVPPSGMRAVDIAVTEPEAGEPERPEEPREATTEPAPAPAPVAVAPAPEDAPADDRTAADRLAPRVVDPRLYEPLAVLPWEPTFEEVEARIWAAVELLSDSALAETEAALRARDWTVRDANGDRWGISPGKLHLGKITVPLPIDFESVDPEREARDAMVWETFRQRERALLLESFRERVRAIRERRDRERAEERAENGGG